jgi:hypothetical protein
MGRPPAGVRTCRSVISPTGISHEAAILFHRLHLPRGLRALASKGCAGNCWESYQRQHRAAHFGGEGLSCPVSRQLDNFSQTSEDGRFAIPARREWQVLILDTDLGQFYVRNTLVAEAPGYRPFQRGYYLGDDQAQLLMLEPETGK